MEEGAEYVRGSILKRMVAAIRRDWSGERLDGHAWCSLVGRPADAPEVQRLLEQLRSLSTYQTIGNGETYFFHQVGVRVDIEDGILGRIEFDNCRQEHPPVRPFPGKLPQHLQFGQNHQTVRDLLGRSVEQFDPGFNPTEWFELPGEQYRLAVTYSKPAWTMLSVRAEAIR
ncbi:MAG: hypothetical protein R3B90_07450 [Planctomycetaceae bacterium]